MELQTDLCSQFYRRNRNIGVLKLYKLWRCGKQRSPLSEYLFLPWLGVTLRGLILRQVPTVGALVYVMAVVDDQGHRLNLLFPTAFSFLFLLEARIALEIARVVRARWERRQPAGDDARAEIETLWTDDDEARRSIEVNNYVY